MVKLVSLCELVDVFFEVVLVNVEDVRVCVNCYVLLVCLCGLFFGVVDISVLG